MNTFTCSHCTKTFNSQRALQGHSRMHGESNGKTKTVKCCCIITKREIQTHSLYAYQASLQPCKQCHALFQPTGSGPKLFCSQSCSASWNNVKRGVRSQSTKQKITDGLIAHHANNPKVAYTKVTKLKKISILKKTSGFKPPKIKPIIFNRDTFKNTIAGDYSIIYQCQCKKCSIIFTSRTQRKYCKEHLDCYSSSAKAGYKFTFNVYHYPDLFDLNQLKQLGWYAPGGKSGKWNPNGLARDHKISINTAVLNDYDPYYITHPLNCELMTQIDNNKKKTKSSITYHELKQLVDSYRKPGTI